MPFSPSTIFDIAVFEADDIAGNDGDAISTWTHQSGSISADMTQSGTAQPLLKKGANGLNSKNVVLFDGVNDFLDFGDVAELDFGTNPFSIFIVMNATTVGGAKGILTKDDTTGAANGLYIYYDSSNIVQYYNGTVQMAAGTVSSTYHMIGFTRSGTGAGGLIPYFDGTAQTAGTEPRTLSNATTASLGRFTDGLFIGGNIAALYIGSSVPSDANRNAFGDYIQTKYGLTIAGAAPLASGRVTNIYMLGG